MPSLNSAFQVERLSGAPTSTKPDLDEALGHAREAYRAARFAMAEAELEALPPDDFRRPEAILLRARLLLRRAPVETLGFIESNLGFLSRPLERAEATMLLGAAHSRVGAFPIAHRILTSAMQLATVSGSADAELSDEIRYQVAAALWMERKLDESERELAAVLEHQPSNCYVEALVLAGAIAAGREQFERQGGTLLEALRIILDEPVIDVYRYAHVTAQLSYLAREMPNPSLRTVAYGHAERVSWAEEIRDLQFTTLKAIGWRHALDGDYFNAFRLLRKAATIAPSDPWKVVAHCDLAYFATAMQEAHWASQELAEATRLADGIEWRAIDGEERLALLFLSELYAATDGALALSYVARLQETGSQFSRLLSINDDRRLKAAVDASLGRIYLKLGYRGEAQTFLVDAWEVFDAVGYDWRAGRAALELYNLTRDEAWYRRAAEKLAAYPNSWIFAEMKSLERSPVPATPQQQAIGRLSPAQLKVYELLKTGLTAVEIATQLQRSENTIRNHINAMYRTLGVRNRAELLRLTYGGATTGRAS